MCYLCLYPRSQRAPICSNKKPSLVGGQFSNYTYGTHIAVGIPTRVRIEPVLKVKVVFFVCCRARIPHNPFDSTRRVFEALVSVEANLEICIRGKRLFKQSYRNILLTEISNWLMNCFHNFKLFLIYGYRTVITELSRHHLLSLEACHE